MIKVRIFKEVKCDTDNYIEALDEVKTLIKEDFSPLDYNYSYEHLTEDEKSIILNCCGDCGIVIEDEWKHCPECGAYIEREEKE